MVRRLRPGQVRHPGSGRPYLPQTDVIYRLPDGFVPIKNLKKEEKAIY